jgi:hypothetical protein
VRPSQAFKKETELCAAFIDAVNYESRRRVPNPAWKAERWIAYPETQGWDILLVREEDGFQIGIEAKLVFNLKVLSQAIEHRYPETPGPDCRAVLVPTAAGKCELEQICAYIGITIITMRERYGPRNAPLWEFDPDLPRMANQHWRQEWCELCPTNRLKLPDYVPDCAAGAPSPKKLTEWKIGAMKIAIILETRPVTRSDFKALGIDHRYWISKGNGILTQDPEGRGWVWGQRRYNFAAVHPRNYAEIKADAGKWMPELAPSML